MTIIDKQTGEIIGTAAANQSLTFDRAMELAGFEWKTLEDDGVVVMDGTTPAERCGTKAQQRSSPICQLRCCPR